MKKITKFLAATLLFTLFALIQQTEAQALTETQKQAIQEAAIAYYNRSTNIQYSNARRDIWFAPEEATSQDSFFLDCDGFARTLYYNTFGINIPNHTGAIAGYGLYNHESNEDIIFFDHDDSLATKKSNINQFKAELLDILEIGDVISYRSTDSNTGHAMLVYDIEKNDSGEKTEAIIIHSTSNFKTANTKLTKGLSWNEKVNSLTSIAEGTLQRITLNWIMNLNVFKNANYLTILRPTIQADTYNNPTCKSDTTSPVGYSCTSERANYQETEASITRRKYPGLYIEAVADQHDNSYVENNSTINYRLTIKNTGSTDYNASVITANLTNGVFKENGEKTLNIPINPLQSGSQAIITLPAAALGDNGSQVSLQAKFDNLPFGEVKHTIGKQLNAEEKSQIKDLYNRLKSDYSGAELIDKIYQGLGYENLGLKDLVLGAQYNDTQTSSGSMSVNQKCNKYFKTEDANALLNSYAGTARKRIALNSENKLAPMVISGYYSAVNTSRSSSTTCEISSVTEKVFGYGGQYDDGDNNGDGRAVFMKSGILQDGDILLYTNREDEITKEDSFLDDKYTVYTFIYSGGEFIGVNLLNDGTPLDTFNANEKYDDKYNLFTLYGRDYYAIIRPALVLKEDEPIPAPIPGEPDEPNTPDEPGNPVPNTSEGDKEEDAPTSSTEKTTKTSDTKSPGTGAMNTNSKTTAFVTTAASAPIFLIAGYLAAKFYRHQKNRVKFD